MSQMYMTEVKTTKNNSTGKVYYFQLICGVFQRISKEKYYKITSHANRSDSFSTKNNGKYLVQHGTYYFYNLASIPV